MRHAPTITLLTDFGTRDPYVGQMKGVLLSLCPGCRIVDLTHEVEARNLRQAAFLLEHSVPYFPVGTVHLCVVDPGVGSDRRALAARVEGSCFVGPDNGVLGVALARDNATIVELSNPDMRLSTVSPTFHGRDVFAPAAGHLAGGVPIGELGPEVTDPVVHEAPTPVVRNGEVRGEVVHVDCFGNLITDIPPSLLEAVSKGGQVSISVGRSTSRPVGLVSHYAAGPPKALVALVSSYGTVELAVSGGSAYELFAAEIGSPVVLTR